MGQPITVTVRPGARPEVRFFECNRSLTGMEVQAFTAASGAEGDRPPAVLAGRLLALGAQRVTVYSNVVVVEAPAAAWADLEGKARFAIEHLFEFYGADAGWSFEARGVDPVPSVVA